MAIVAKGWLPCLVAAQRLRLPRSVSPQLFPEPLATVARVARWFLPATALVVNANFESNFPAPLADLAGAARHEQRLPHCRRRRLRSTERYLGHPIQRKGMISAIKRHVFITSTRVGRRLSDQRARARVKPFIRVFAKWRFMVKGLWKRRNHLYKWTRGTGISIKMECKTIKFSFIFHARDDRF